LLEWKRQKDRLPLMPRLGQAVGVLQPLLFY
jgi:hypothetical protein